MKKPSLLITFISILMSNIYSVNAQDPDFLFMVEQAIKAPSGHNTQPWLFKVNLNSIEIHPNFDKSLPVVDFDNRELFISLGCATENLCIAASNKGYESIVSTSESGVITVNLLKNKSVITSPLSKQIAVRQTNRSIYNGNIIPEDTLAILKTIDKQQNISVYFYKNGSPDFDSLSNYVFRGNTIQMQDEAFKSELRGWMRYNKKHQDTTKDGLSYAVFGAPNLPMFIVKPIMSKALNEKSQNKGDRKKIFSSSHLILFTIQNNSIAEWIDLGRYLERFLLQATELGITHAYLNQPNEIRELSSQMMETLNSTNEYPAILLRIGYGERMPYSKRKEAKEVILSFY